VPEGGAPDGGVPDDGPPPPVPIPAGGVPDGRVPFICMPAGGVPGVLVLFTPNSPGGVPEGAVLLPVKACDVSSAGTVPVSGLCTVAAGAAFPVVEGADIPAASWVHPAVTIPAAKMMPAIIMSMLIVFIRASPEVLGVTRVFLNQVPRSLHLEPIVRSIPGRPLTYIHSIPAVMT